MIKDFDIILAQGESSTVEFKANPDKSLAAEVCAFANASGGRIFIGVDDSGKDVGTDVWNSSRSQVQNTVSQIKPFLNVDVSVHGNIIVVTVPEGRDKPYSCPQGFYLRSGPNSQKLDHNTIVEFFQNESRIRYDELVREDLPLDERFNETAYKHYLGLAKISTVFDKTKILLNLNCAAERGGKVYFTNAGALFFRHNEEQVMFDHTQVVCALYKGKDKSYILDVKHFKGDIVSNIDNAILFLKKHLKLTYRIKTLRREEILELPEDALREAVVNAVCHRNYFEKGANIMIEVYDDRVDIISPGGLCKGITPETFGTVSVTRNSVIAAMLHRIDYIEKMGTGILRMKNATAAANVPDPEYNISEFFIITFKRTADGRIKIPEAAIGNPEPAIGTSEQAIGTPEPAIGVAECGTKSGVKSGTKSGAKSGTKSGTKSNTKFASNSELVRMLKLCKKPQTMHELLSAFSVTSRSKFQKKYIKPLIEKGSLLMTIPDKPNNPKQKYVAANSYQADKAQGDKSTTTD